MALFGKSDYFNKNIPPKCVYCVYGNRTKEGNKVLCERLGLVEEDYVCKKYIYSPLKRIPVKQLDIHGNNNEDVLYNTTIKEYTAHKSN